MRYACQLDMHAYRVDIFAFTFETGIQILTT